MSKPTDELQQEVNAYVPIPNGTSDIDVTCLLFLYLMQQIQEIKNDIMWVKGRLGT